MGHGKDGDSQVTEGDDRLMRLCMYYSNESLNWPIGPPTIHTKAHSDGPPTIGFWDLAFVGKGIRRQCPCRSYTQACESQGPPARESVVFRGSLCLLKCCWANRENVQLRAGGKNGGREWRG